MTQAEQNKIDRVAREKFMNDAARNGMGVEQYNNHLMSKDAKKSVKKKKK